jgi:hypothetical protein
VSRAGPPSAPAGWRASARSPQHAAQRFGSADRPRCWLAPAPAPEGRRHLAVRHLFSAHSISVRADPLLHAFNTPPDPRPLPRAAALAGGVCSPTAMRPAHAVTRRAVRCRSFLCPAPRTPALPFRGLAFPLCLSPSPSTPAADPALTRASPRWPSTRASACLSRAADGKPENDALSAL